MPLSEHEKRLLDEIEQTLRTDDPALASSLRSARPQRRTRSFVMLAVVALALGSTLLFVGLRLNSAVGVVLGVAGAAFIVAGTDFGLRVTSRVRADRHPENRRTPNRREP